MLLSKKILIGTAVICLIKTIICARKNLTDSSSFAPFGMQTIFIGNKYSIFLLVTKEVSFTSKIHQQRSKQVKQHMGGWNALAPTNSNASC